MIEQTTISGVTPDLGIESINRTQEGKLLLLFPEVNRTQYKILG